MWLMIVDLVKRSNEIQVPSKARNLLTTAGNVVFLRRTPLLSLSGTTAPSGPGPPHSRGFYITQRRTTVGRSPLDEGSARRRDLYLITHNTHSRQTSMPPLGFEPIIEPPQTYALDRAATGTGTLLHRARELYLGLRTEFPRIESLPAGDTLRPPRRIPLHSLPVFLVRSVYMNDNRVRTFASKKFFGLVEIDWSGRSRM